MSKRIKIEDYRNVVALTAPRSVAALRAMSVAKREAVRANAMTLLRDEKFVTAYEFIKHAEQRNASVAYRAALDATVKLCDTLNAKADFEVLAPATATAAA